MLYKRNTLVLLVTIFILVATAAPAFAWHGKTSTHVDCDGWSVSVDTNWQGHIGSIIASNNLSGSWGNDSSKSWSVTVQWSTGETWSDSGDISQPDDCGEDEPEVCPYNPELTADDENCKPPEDPEVCKWNPELPASDPLCKKPQKNHEEKRNTWMRWASCDWREEMVASHLLAEWRQRCAPAPVVCPWNADLLASDLGCVEPKPQLCGPALPGFVSCEQEISWMVADYVIGNPDPFAVVRGVTFEQYMSGWLEVNREAVADINVWESKYYPGEVDINYFYEDITLGDKVEIIANFKGLETLRLPVKVVDAAEGFGNPATSAMISEDGQLFVYPGNTVEHVAEVTRYSGSISDLVDLHRDAHVATIFHGEVTEIPEDLKKKMGIFDESQIVAFSVAPTGTGVFWEVSSGDTWSGLLYAHNVTDVYALIESCEEIVNTPLKAGLPVQVPQCVIDALPPA